MSAAGIVAIGKDEKRLTALRMVELELGRGIDGVPERGASTEGPAPAPFACTGSALKSQRLSAAWKEFVSKAIRTACDLLLQCDVLVDFDYEPAVFGAYDALEEMRYGGLTFCCVGVLAITHVEDDSELQGRALLQVQRKF